MKITTHITFFYLESRIQYLNRIIDETNKYEYTTDIFIHTNKQDLDPTTFHEYTNGRLEIIFHDLTDIDPFRLAWKCRSLLQQQKDEYDIFMYIEDDILVPYKAIKYWFRHKQKMKEVNCNLGFLRIEVDDNAEYATDLTEQLETITKFDNEPPFCVVNNPYCAFWIYDKEEFHRFVSSEYYDVNNIRGYNTREQSAIGLHGIYTNWYGATLIPVCEGNTMLVEDCKIYHMPNNYAMDKTTVYGSIKFTEALKPQNTVGPEKTLVIILSETRAHELTFENFKRNVIDELNADLCLCIGTKPDYDYDNPFYKLAKYKFTYDEPDDFSDAFEYAYGELSQNRPKYECLNNINALHCKLAYPEQPVENITYYGKKETITNFDDFGEEDEIVIHKTDTVWRNQVYGIKKSDNRNLISEENVITYKKPLYWREFLKINDQFLGGVKDIHHQHPGSAGILIFFRWFLLKNLIENDLINKYDRFIITRSDFMYQLPHPKVKLMDEKNIWIPDGEGYGGFTDRHVVLGRQNIRSYLDIFSQMVIRSNDYFMKMKNYREWNLERLIKFHLAQHGLLNSVKMSPYIMYAVRNINGTTRWSEGIFSEKLGHYIKYENEYIQSTHFKNEFETSGLTIDEFYQKKFGL